MDGKSIATHIQEICFNVRNKNMHFINTGLYFKTIFNEAKDEVNDFIMKLTDANKTMVGVNNETMYLLITAQVFYIDLQISIESDEAEPYKRELILADMYSANCIDFKIYDYSIYDLVDNKRFSRHSFNLINHLTELLYNLRGEVRYTNERFYYDGKDLQQVNEFFVDRNMPYDTYQYNEQAENIDEEYLEESYDDDDDEDDDGKESEVFERWGEAIETTFKEFGEWVTTWSVLNSLNIELGEDFDGLYSTFIGEYRRIEDKYQPLDKKSRENPLDMFIFFCENIIKIKVGFNDYNANTLAIKKSICGNTGNELIIDEFTLEKPIDDMTITEVISEIKIVNITNTKVFYNSMKTIYEFRQFNVNGGE